MTKNIDYILTQDPKGWFERFANNTNVDFFKNLIDLDFVVKTPILLNPKSEDCLHARIVGSSFHNMGSGIISAFFHPSPNVQEDAYFLSYAIELDESLLMKVCENQNVDIDSPDEPSSGDLGEQVCIYRKPKFSPGFTFAVIQNITPAAKDGSKRVGQYSMATIEADFNESLKPHANQKDLKILSKLKSLCCEYIEL